MPANGNYPLAHCLVSASRFFGPHDSAPFPSVFIGVVEIAPKYHALNNHLTLNLPFSSIPLSPMTTHNPLDGLRSCLCVLLISGAVVAAGSAAADEQQAENAPRPFDARKVAKLSHEAYKIAWNARFWAHQDLIWYMSYNPTALDWEAVYYLAEISRKVSWVARKIEKHPATARSSSKRASDFARYDTILLKKVYYPASFRRSTDLKIDKLLGLLDEISSYYDEKSGTSSKDNNHTSQ